MVLVCHVIEQNHLSNGSSKFDDHRHCGTGEIMVYFVT